MAPPSPQYLAQNNAPKILSIVGVFGFLALVTVFLRLYVRGAMLRFTGADDAVIALSMGLGIAVFVCFVGEAANGLGRHHEVITNPSIYFQWLFAHSLVSLFGIATVKVSVSLLLLRLVPQKNYRRILWAIIGFLTFYTIFCAFTIIFSCTPISANWNLSHAVNARCFSSTTYTNLGIANSVFNILTDSILAMLPIPVVMGLQLNKRTKIALSAILSMGFIAVACGAVKVYYQWRVIANIESGFNDGFYLWAALELYLGIIACSLPSLRPLVVMALKSARNTLGVSTQRAGEQYTIPRDYRRSLGHRNHADLGTSASETALKNGVFATITPGTPDVQSRDSQEISFFGTNSNSYNVGIERSFSSSNIALEDLAPTIPSSGSKGLKGAERTERQGGIMRTTRVVTHSEALPS
ncbi:hypothetical protein BDV97DRAFT_289559 [Delphinella strobiligena]|nr:hypothetical protein BDV97DRAFT_289559 [Delphinella strobiligena]